MKQEKSESTSAATIAARAMIAAAVITAISVITVAIINKYSGSNQVQSMVNTNNAPALDRNTSREHSNSQSNGNENRTTYQNHNENRTTYQNHNTNPVTSTPTLSNLPSIQVGGFDAGTLNDREHKDYKLAGIENTPIDFIMQREDGGFWYRLIIFDSSGIKVYEHESSAMLTEKFTFVPESTEMYKLQLKGERNSGTYVLKLPQPKKQSSS
jgi:hypothetical protein